MKPSLHFSSTLIVLVFKFKFLHYAPHQKRQICVCFSVFQTSLHMKITLTLRNMNGRLIAVFSLSPFRVWSVTPSQPLPLSVSRPRFDSVESFFFFCPRLPPPPPPPPPLSLFQLDFKSWHAFNPYQTPFFPSFALLFSPSFFCPPLISSSPFPMPSFLFSQSFSSYFLFFFPFLLLFFLSLLPFFPHLTSSSFSPPVSFSLFLFLFFLSRP